MSSSLLGPIGFRQPYIIIKLVFDFKESKYPKKRGVVCSRIIIIVDTRQYVESS